MGETRLDRAARLESLFPRVLRTMFKPVANDPLVDLPVGQMRMMRLLATRSWTPSGLGDELGLSVSAVTQMANRLDAIGLVTRTEDPMDRRVKHLSLTPRGSELMTKRQDRRVHHLVSVLSCIPDARQIEIIEAMEELLDASVRASESIDNSILTEAEVEQMFRFGPPLTKEFR